MDPTVTRGAPLKVKRGVAWCANEDCAELYKLRFMLNIDEQIGCGVCFQSYRTVRETAEVCGLKPFREVRIEYNFDPSSELFRDVAILRNEDAPRGAGYYTLRSPLLKTEKRAFMRAEAILSELQTRQPESGELVEGRELTLSFDDSLELLRAKLATWEEGRRALEG